METSLREDGLVQAANVYAESIPLEQRRRDGKVYTPSHLVEFILDGVAEDPAEFVIGPALDPACGAGVFLEALVSRVADALQADGIRIDQDPGRELFLSAVAANVFGVDLDPQAVQLAHRAMVSQVVRLSPGFLPDHYLTANVVHADFLFNPVDQLLKVTDGFRLIVGNPPYVSATRLGQAYKEHARAAFQTASGRLDLYTLFMERAAGLLCHGGRLAFITPDKFLISHSAGPIRSLLGEEGALRSVALFGSHQVFENAATVPCVMVWEKGVTQGQVAISECSDKPSSQGSVSVLRRRHISRERLGLDGWDLATDEVYELIQTITAGHPRLRSLVSRVSAGIATGLDRVFLIPPEDRNLIEPELLKPALRGRDVRPFSIKDPGLWLLIPYQYNDDGRPTLVDIASYPGALQYLSRYRKDLMARHCVRVWGKAWYDIHDPIPFDLSTRSKIVVPDVAANNRFANDAEGFWPLHSAYYLLPREIDPLLLSAILNSPPIEFLVRARAPRVKDGFSRYRRQFLLDLPVPATGQQLACEIVEAAAGGSPHRATELTTSLFGISPDRIQAGFSLVNAYQDRQTLVDDAIAS